MADYICARCGRAFSDAPGKRRKYCSQACYRATSKRVPPRVGTTHNIRDRAWLESQIRRGVSYGLIAYQARCSLTQVYRIAREYGFEPYQRSGGKRHAQFRVPPDLAQKLGLSEEAV